MPSDRNDLVIVGAGGHGREALSVVRATNAAGRSDWEFRGFADDGDVDPRLLDRLGAQLLGGIEVVTEGDAEFVIAIGDNEVRRRIAHRIGRPTAAILVDPTAWIGPDVAIGEGAMVYPGSRCTTNVVIGRHSHVNCGATVSHDCRIGDFVSVSPGALINGGVTIGDGAFIGTGAIVLPGIEIGPGATIGAGAVVTSDVETGRTLVGVPARPMTKPTHDPKPREDPDHDDDHRGQRDR